VDHDQVLSDMNEDIPESLVAMISETCSSTPSSLALKLLQTPRLLLPLSRIPDVVAGEQLTLGGLGGEAGFSGSELLGVLLSPPDLALKGTVDLNELDPVLVEGGGGVLSHDLDLVDEGVKENLAADLSLLVLDHEGGETYLEVLKKGDAPGKGFSVKSRSDLDEGGDGVGVADLGELGEDLSGVVGCDGLQLGDDDLKCLKDFLSLFGPDEVLGVVAGPVLTDLLLMLVEEDELGLTGLDGLLEVSLPVPQGLDSGGGLLDLVVGMLDAVVVLGDLSVTLDVLSGLGFISLFLLSLDVGDHVPEEGGDVVHGGVRLQLEGDGVEQILTELGRVDLVKDVVELVVRAQEGRASERRGADQSDDKEGAGFHCCEGLRIICIL